MQFNSIQFNPIQSIACHCHCHCHCQYQDQYQYQYQCQSHSKRARTGTTPGPGIGAGIESCARVGGPTDMPWTCACASASASASACLYLAPHRRFEFRPKRLWEVRICTPQNNLVCLSQKEMIASRAYKKPCWLSLSVLIPHSSGVSNSSKSTSYE